jgi:hypothetical protein
MKRGGSPVMKNLTVVTLLHILVYQDDEIQDHEIVMAYSTHCGKKWVGGSSVFTVG